MKITLSINAILAQVYAQVAITHTIKGSDTPVITPDSADALKTLARSAAANIVLALLPTLTDTNLDIPDPEEDIIEFSMIDNLPLNPIELRLLAEHTIASHLLAELYAVADPTASQHFQTDNQTHLHRIRIMIAAATPASINPYPAPIF